MSISGSRRLASGLGLLLLAVLCTACEARLLVDVAVHDDGSGVLAVTLRADAELLDRAQEAGADPLGDLAAAGAGVADAGWVTRDQTGEDGSRAVTLSAPFSDAVTFNALAGELEAALAAPEVTLLEGLSLAFDDERIRVDGRASLVPAPAVTDLGLQPEQAVALLTDAFAYEVTLALPGEVLESTATAGGAEDQPLRWSLTPGQEVELRAVGERPRPSPLLVGAAVAAGGVAALVLVRRYTNRAGTRGRHAS